MILSFLLLPTLALAASSKLEKYKALAAQNDGIISLNSALYEEITASPRDYSLSIVLTAMAGQYKCAPCQSFAPEHAMVAKHWSKSSKRDQHLFAVLDFPDGTAIYQKLGLSSAPTFQLWKPTEGERATNSAGFTSVDFSKIGFQAENVANHLRESAGIPLQFSRPIDKAKLAKNLASIVGIAISCYIMREPITAFVFSKYLWAVLSVATIITMISGYMWNQIRKPAYSEIQNGRTNYFQGGYQNQFGGETHILMGVYGILGFATYSLTNIIPSIQDPVKQRLGVYVWTAISFFMLGVLMSIFTIKQGGYPFKLF